MIEATPNRPLRIAVLVKQVPALDDMVLGDDGRLQRDDRPSEIDAYGRRAAALGVALASASGGTTLAITMGPPAARDVLRECLAGGIDRGVHLCDPALAGADTLATATALAAVLRIEGPFDLVLAGRAAVDADTGQVPPQLATLLDLRFAGGAKHVDLRHDVLHLGLEHDDRWLDVEVPLPALVTCAERLCDPLKLRDPALWAGIDESSIVERSTTPLGVGPWGAAGSPTVVRSVAPVRAQRAGLVVDGPIDAAVASAVDALRARGALRDAPPAQRPSVVSPAPAPGRSPVAVVIEPGRLDDGVVLLGEAAALAAARASDVVALVERGVIDADLLGAAGATQVRGWDDGAMPAQVAEGVAGWAALAAPWSLLIGGTDWGREVGARIAARRGAGMTGDALALAVDGDGRLEARKAALGGAAEAVIGCDRPLHVASVRPGVLGERQGRIGVVAVVGTALELPAGDGTVRREVRSTDDRSLLDARRVVGVGQGVAPDELEALDALVEVLGATVGATRKWTDGGWLPRARQIGVTGAAIAPELYVAVGISGKATHMVGVRGAGTVLAIDIDPDAAVFAACDVGIVGDWRDVVPLLVAALRAEG